MRVLITGSTPRLGLSFQFAQLSIWLRKQGMDIVIAGCDGEASPGLLDAVAAAGVSFRDVPELRRTGLRQLLRPSGGLARLVDETQPHVAVITAIGHVAEVGRIRARQTKVVWWLRSVRNTKFYAAWARRLAAITANRFSDQVWVQCNTEKDNMIAAGINESLVRLVPTPIDVDWWDEQARCPLPPEFQPVAQAKSQGRPVLVYPASLLPGKRHDVLLRAIALVKEQFPTLFLCCPGRFSADRLRPLVSTLGLTENTMFTESLIRQDAIPPLLANADGMVFSSESETFGKALIEAFCLRLPTVSTRVGVAVEAEQAGVARVCQVGDYRTMASETVRFLRDRDLRHELGRKARRWVEDNYSYPAVGGKVLRLLETLSASPPVHMGET